MGNPISHKRIHHSREEREEATLPKKMKGHPSDIPGADPNQQSTDQEVEGEGRVGAWIVYGRETSSYIPTTRMRREGGDADYRQLEK